MGILDAGPLREVLRNPAIVRVELAWLLATTAQWAYLVVLLVYAYGVGGVVLAGLVTTLRMLPAAFLAPFLSTLADRIAPVRVLLLGGLARFALVAISVALVVMDGPAALVVAAAILEGVLAAVARPATMALLPALARSPEELVSANAVTSTGEAMGTLVGPALGGLLLALGGTALGFGGPTVILALVVLALAGTHAGVAPPDVPARTTSTMREMTGGFAALATHRAAGILVALFSAQTLVRGMLTVLLVAASVELLGLGDAGVGYLSSAIGAGGLVGSIAAITLIGRRRLAVPFSLALAAWGVPIALLGIVPAGWLAFAFLGVVGLANAILDVSGYTLMQRCVPNRLRGRVFGALEGVASLTFGLGSLLAPLLVALLDLRAALVVAGALLPLLAAATAAAVRGADDAAVVPHRELELLRSVPMFRPLGMTTLERLASGMRPVSFADGEALMRQGGPGDVYFVLSAGEGDVIRDGEPINRIGPGEGCGEIALLRDTPRTATVVARGPVEAYRLERELFLAAVTGTASSLAAADRIVGERMAAIEH
jgi:MFS family permease